MDKLREWATQAGIDVQAIFDEQNADFKALIMTEIEEFSRLRKLNSLEKPREIYITQEAFSVDNDLLTPTFKLKRNVGKKVFQTQIDAMYAAMAARGLWKRLKHKQAIRHQTEIRNKKSAKRS